MTKYRIAMARALWMRGMDAETIAGRLGIDEATVCRIMSEQ